MQHRSIEDMSFIAERKEEAYKAKAAELEDKSS